MQKSRCLHAGCLVLLQNYIFKTDLDTKAYCMYLPFQSQTMKGSVETYLDVLEGSLQIKRSWYTDR